VSEIAGRGFDMLRRRVEASQNKSDVTSRFGDRDFVLAVCTDFSVILIVSKLLAIFVR
jgi:hypothetical protein